MKKESTIGLVGIGIFLCLILQEISSLLSELFERFLLFPKIKPMLLCGIFTYLIAGITLLCFILIVRKLGKRNFDESGVLKRTFIFCVLAFAGGQLLEFALPFVTESLRTPQYLDAWLNYREELNRNVLLKELSIGVPAFTIKYGLIAIIVLRRIKTNRNKTVSRKPNPSPLPSK
ncbi:MAG TPA: hypothetical protein VL651_17040 [Bacteroidia bacterium]|jgi:hypothetical protein|nr:hypothetical protein [Bacteroidia bacterium]